MDLKVRVDGPTTVDLTWTPGSPSVQDKYEVIYKSDVNHPAWSSVITTTLPTTTLTDLFPGDKYTFQVIAWSNDQKSDPVSKENVTCE